MLASQAGEVDVVDQLLAVGAKPNRKERSGQIAFHRSVVLLIASTGPYPACLFLA